MRPLLLWVLIKNGPKNKTFYVAVHVDSGTAQQVGLLGCWVVGLLGCWVVGLLGGWVRGVGTRVSPRAISVDKGGREREREREERKRE